MMMEDHFDCDHAVHVVPGMIVIVIAIAIAIVRSC